jgi:hypothetical protein
MALMSGFRSFDVLGEPLLLSEQATATMPPFRLIVFKYSRYSAKAYTNSKKVVFKDVLQLGCCAACLFSGGPEPRLRHCVMSISDDMMSNASGTYGTYMMPLYKKDQTDSEAFFVINIILAKCHSFGRSASKEFTPRH